MDIIGEYRWKSYNNKSIHMLTIWEFYHKAKLKLMWPFLVNLAYAIYKQVNGQNLLN